MGNYITDNQGPGVLVDARGGDAVIGYTPRPTARSRTSTAATRAATGSRTTTGAGVRVPGRRCSDHRARQPHARQHRARRRPRRTRARPPTTSGRRRLAEHADRRRGRSRRAASSRRRIVGRLDRFDAARTLIDVYGFASTRRRSRAARAAASTSAPRSRTPRASGSSRPPRPTPAYGAVMTDRHGNTSELSPLCAGDRTATPCATTGRPAASTTTPTARPTCACRIRAPARSSPTSSSRSTGRRAASRTWRRCTPSRRRSSSRRGRSTCTRSIGEEVPGDGADQTPTAARPSGAGTTSNDFLRGLNDDDPCDGLASARADDRDGEECYAILGARKLAYRYAIFATSRAGRQLRRGRPGRRRVPRHARRLPARGHHARRRFRPGRLQPPVRRVRRAARGGGVHARARAHARPAARRRQDRREQRAELPVDHELLVPDAGAAQQPAARLLAQDADRAQRGGSSTRRCRSTRPTRSAPASRGRKRRSPRTPRQGQVPDPARRPRPDDRPQRRRRAEDPRRWASTTSTSTTTRNGPEECQKPENHTFLTGIDDWSRLRYSRHGLPAGTRASTATRRRGACRRRRELAAGDRHRRRRHRRRQGRLPRGRATRARRTPTRTGSATRACRSSPQRDVSVEIQAASANVPVGEERTVEVDRPQLVPEARHGRRGGDHAARRRAGRHDRAGRSARSRCAARSS